MSQFQGKWKVVSEENLDELFMAFGVDSEMRSKTKEGLIKPTQEITVNANEYRVKTIVGHLSTEVTFKLGVEFPSSSMDGKKIMVRYNLDGNKLIEVQKYDNQEATVTREVIGNQLVTGEVSKTNSSCHSLGKQDLLL
ncbi:Hypothetical predicted protein [Mytilus galloprovincialis]|uniref:Lipocalin/cytosolic fatty-acid binding domain-containing protein n=1 Tax=Mytilus galloprovincialis TaxID=29158 RepID=A0A8B6FCL4_MYTGA|nr:Hypothetical predicted protein [Mytilus galloprovincialis]